MARGKKYKPKKAETQRSAANLASIRQMATDVKNSKPKKLDVKRKEFTNDTPKRPSIPKLPKLNLPGGGLKKTKVAAPSGRPKMINDYKPVSDYSKTYKNRNPKRPT
jgi:hypothetical protein